MIRFLTQTTTQFFVEDQAELVASRQVQRELRGEVAEASTELAAERAAHAANRQIQRELRSTSAELSLELSSRRAFQLALRNATRATSGKIGKRNRRSALRNVASMPGEALPLWGAAVIVGVTALEVYDLCQTMIDMTELQKLFDPNLAIPEDQLTVCNIEVPSRKEIWEAARTSPETAWNSARDAMPTAEEFRALELPDFEWTTLGETIGSTTSEWGRVVSDIAGKKFDQLNNWWN